VGWMTVAFLFLRSPSPPPAVASSRELSERVYTAPGSAAAAAADPGAVYTRSLNSLLLATAGGGEGLRRKRKATVIQPTLGPLQVSALVAAANRSKEKRIGNESMPIIIINNTKHLFLNLEFSIFVIS